MIWDFQSSDPEEARFDSHVIPHPHSSEPHRFLSAKPLELAKFRINHSGSETASFGLARYPEAISEHREKIFNHATGLTGWRWRDFCKTQYASLMRVGGWKNFLNIHDSICRLLDKAQRLGISVEVSDDGGYWKDRNLESLRQRLEECNRLVAAVAGTFKDAVGDRGVTIAPVTGHSAFERLEAEGRDPKFSLQRRPR